MSSKKLEFRKRQWRRKASQLGYNKKHIFHELLVAAELSCILYKKAKKFIYLQERIGTPGTDIRQGSKAHTIYLFNNTDRNRWRPTSKKNESRQDLGTVET